MPKAKGAIASNRRGKLHISRTNHSTGKVVINVNLVFNGGMEDVSSGVITICNEAMEGLGDFNGCQLKGHIRVWAESPIRKRELMLQNQMEKLRRQLGFAKEIVRKEVTREVLEAFEESCPAVPTKL